MAVKASLITIYNDVYDEHLFVFAAGLSCYFVLSLFPLLVSLASLLAFVPIPHLFEGFLGLMARLVPGDGMSLVRSILSDVSSHKHTQFLTLGLIFTIWTASSGFAATIDGLDVVWRRDWFVRVVLSLWVATHRIHHQFADQEGDPHSPRDGKCWSHMGWILTGRSMHHDTITLAHYVPDLAKDKFHMWITKYHYLPMVALGLLLFALGGLPFLVWGIFLRTVVGLHATWLVNSATHIWGAHPFSTRDDSTNNWFVAPFDLCEGWHNNHHAHPTSARHGLKWYEIDMNWYGIWVLKVVGLATQITSVRTSGLDRKEIPTRGDLTLNNARHVRSAAGN